MTKPSISFSFTELTESDLPLLLEWFAQRHVSQWWPVPEKEEALAKFIARIRSRDTLGYIVKMNDTPMGYVQVYTIDRSNEKTGSWLPALPEYTVGTDQFIGEPEFLGKGYGTLFIKAFIEYLWQTKPELTTIIVDPDPQNIAAIRCYEKVGFISMGTYQAPWGPAQLMRYDKSFAEN